MLTFLAKLLGGPVVGSLVEAGKGALQGWAERSKIRTMAKVEREAKLANAEIDWDTEQVRASASSWKDEFWTIVLAIPVVMAFIPSLAPYVGDGFAVLNSTPDWYKGALGVAIAAAFGVRQFAKVMDKRKGK